ncbi:efflux RND transporter periplasmic adaptor subunit [Mucilaginibacter daejeonensis]|uniref:efflux RND transporter periplasmic adaptor subunit n=1 Tax=Mucilaginibacter daejeonensis TaxID=398049 RepID=UPI001D17B66A|nr:efflux RND transporter periplasmic adaptor subunit [Mucilaginibacter daejeonensis]UEG53332.1 efflux RND transporter periplasmic adaptor subunit [Mucilaginibacter daejeonensis]
MKPLALILATALLYGCAEKPAQQQAAAPQALPVTEIHTDTATTYQEYPASVEGAVNVEIRPQVSGTLDRVYADEGAFVKAGTPLFKINDNPYRQALNNAKASLHAAEGALSNAKLEVEKLTPLVQNKVVSDYQLKAAKAAQEIAQGNVEQARAQVGTAQINLGYTTIKAPVSGYIGRLLKKQGSLVGPADAQALTQLSDVHDVHVYFSLGENDFIGFKDHYAGNTLNDKIRHLPPVSLVMANQSVYARNGHIDMVDGQFDKTTGAITVRATFPNSEGLLRSGNTGKVRLSLKLNDVARVPQEATIEMQDKVFVFAVGDSNKVAKQPIIILGRSGSDYLVKDGVKNGQQIVLSGIDRLQEGTKIAPQKVADKSAAIAKN